MGVDRLFDDDARALTRQMSTIDSEAHLRSILAALDADDAAQDSADTEASAYRTPAGQAPAYRPDAEQFGTWPDSELTQCLRQATEGDAASARRVAELLELKDQDTEAATWWNRAAAAGDPDATIYIEGSHTT
jgi:hypothetical protein